MPIKIIKRRSSAFVLRVAAVVIVAFLVVGAVARYKKQRGSTEGGKMLLQTVSRNLLIPILCLDVSDKQVERVWSEALAKYLKGDTEVQFPGGRADIVNEHYAIEVDFIHKWKEGLGQAIVYGEHFGKTPALALIISEPTEIEDVERIKGIDSLTSKKGVKSFLLMSYRKGCDR